jgi:hypothetical protein
MMSSTLSLQTMLKFLSIISLSVHALFSSNFLGLNNGDRETTTLSLSDKTFQAHINSLKPATYRFPAGTAANYWDWKAGCQQGSNKCGTIVNKVEDLASFLQSSTSTITPILVVNMLTDTLASQLQFLDAAKNAGVPIEVIELGNEFFNNHADYVAKFPTGKEYGTECTKWITSISKVYPNVTFLAVGAPSVIGNNARKESWNKDMFSTLIGTNSVTMHEYHDSMLPAVSSFKASDVPTMLGAPFYYMDGINTAADTLPTGVDVYMTEFNLKDDVASGICGTWAHGLYIATEILLAVNSSRISHVNIHCTIEYATLGSLFSDTTSFDFPLSPDTTLVTTEFGKSATGYASTLLSTAMNGASTAVSNSLSPPPSVINGASGVTYPAVISSSFLGGSQGNTAVLINLNAAYTFDPIQLNGGPFTQFSTIHAAATVPVNNEQALTFVNGTVSSSMTLPAHSITVLYS